MERGQVYACPLDSRRNCVNPYFTDATRPEFIQTGWGAFRVVNTGHALGYLARYELARIRRFAKRKPSLDEAVAAIDPTNRGIGTLTPTTRFSHAIELLGSPGSGWG